MAEGTPSIWARAMADPAFRRELVEDPLRAVASAHDLDVSAEQVRRLEDMTRDQRAELVQELIRRVTRHHLRGQWGDHFWTPDDETESDAGG